MEAVKIKVGGKEYLGKLSADAIELIERQFDAVSVAKLVSEKQSYTVFKAVIVACVLGEDPNAKDAEVREAVKAEFETGAGMLGLGEIVLELVNASNLGKARGK